MLIEERCSFDWILETNIATSGVGEGSVESRLEISRKNSTCCWAGLSFKLFLFSKFVFVYEKVQEGK